MADIRTPDMLNLPVPKANSETIVAQPSAAVTAYVDTLVARAERIRSGCVPSHEDNMLAVTTDGRKAALDLRLVDEFAEDYEGSKLNLCARKVHEWWVKSADIRGTQLVFCDMSVPRSDGRFSVYNDLRQKLIVMGIPESEIAFIHDFETEAKKEAAFEKVRSGDIRVLMGSTAKMGVGTNVQNRLVCLHGLDVPWRPCDLEQRDGRIVRQGNMNKEVWLFKYVTEATLDAFVWDAVERKARFIAQVMTGNMMIRSIEDVSLVALSYAEIKALATGNPLILEQSGVNAELIKLSIIKNAWDKQRWSNRMEISNIPAQEMLARQKGEAISRDIATTTSANTKGALIEVGGSQCKTRVDAANELMSVLQALPRNSGVKVVGSYRGLDLCAERLGNGETQSWLQGAHTYGVDARTALAVIDRIVEQVEDLPQELQAIERRLTYLAQRLVDLQVEVVKPFERQSRLDWLANRQREIEDALDLTKTDMTATDETAEADSAVES